MYRSGFLWSQHFVLEDNVNLTEEYKADLRRQYHGVFKLRFLDGLWVPAEGAIYGSLINDDILFSESDRPLGLYNAGGFQARTVSIDYGTTNAFAAIEWLDDGRIAWGIREYCFDSEAENCQKTDAEYANALTEWLERSPTGRGKNVELVIDPSAASFKLEMMRRGFYVTDADNEVLDGIRMVSTMLGNHTLRFHKDHCPKAVIEHQGYSWNPTARLRGVEEPIKNHDHFPDSARYYVRTKLNNPWRLALVA
jgi:hypothetical protein